MKKAEISKIVIDVGGKKIELTKQQAEQMKEVLDELFGVKVVERHHHHNYPIGIPYWRWDKPYIYCGTSDNTMQSKVSYDNGTVLCALDGGK